MKKSVTIVILFTAILLSSCVKDLDFEQAKSLVLKPKVTTSLINFNLSQKEDFIEGTTEKTSFKKRSEVTFFNNETAKKEHLRKIELNVEVSNEILSNKQGREFTINIVFLDENETVIYDGLTDIIVAENKTDFKRDDTISIVDKPEILEAKYIEVTVEMAATSNGILDNSIEKDKKLTFKSSATLYMNF